jgi:hypothetical protein
MRRAAPRQSERSSYYGLILEPERPTPAIMAAAEAPPAETAEQRAERLARKRTVPAPKSRLRGPRGRSFTLDKADDEQVGRRDI